MKSLLGEIKSHKIIYFLLFVILFIGLFLRVYNIGNLLGFYFDQGRDALIVWDIWHKGDIPFIGPTTGIAGIFRGPFYYYLIAPFYLIGGGNPVFPSVFLSITTVLASLLMYYLGFKIQDRTTGLIAAFISSISFNIVMASRWLSNPTPMLLISLTLIWAMLKKNWPVIGVVFGLSLFHFGSSGEFFYLFAIIIFALWQGLPDKKTILISFGIFLLTALPLIAFDIKNNGLLISNIKEFIFTDKSFGAPSGGFITNKFLFYYNVFTSKIFNARYNLEKLALFGVSVFFVLYLKYFIKIKGVMILLILLLSVMVGLIFFQGNFGNIYDYYLTGYYLPFILLFSIVLGKIWKFRLGKVFVAFFFYVFVTNNIDVLKFKLTDSGLGEHSISFIVQKEAIDWISQDSKGKKFNVDVYVPPVIPYAYDYLMKWKKLKPEENQVTLLYTLYEEDRDHQERLDAWLERQSKIGKIEETKKFGAIIVERRIRF